MNTLLREQVEALEEHVEALENSLRAAPPPLPAVSDAITSRVELAAQLAALNATLSKLPEQLRNTSKEFKELYPDGVFCVQLDIDIRSNVNDKDAKDLSPKRH